MNRYPAKQFKRFLPRDYKKRDVVIIENGKVTLHDLNWSGGTRLTYTVLDADGGPISDTKKYSDMAPWENPAEGVTLPIPLGAIVVCTGHFCGKTAIAYIYANPGFVQKELTYENHHN